MKTTPRPYLHVYLMVLHDGAVYWDHGATCQQVHEASFVIVKEDDGTLFVWKDRFGEHGRTVNAAWSGIRAAQHLGWIDLVQRGEAAKANEVAAQLCRSAAN